MARWCRMVKLKKRKQNLPGAENPCQAGFFDALVGFCQQFLRQNADLRTAVVV